eukprot:gene10217-12088_t
MATDKAVYCPHHDTEARCCEFIPFEAIEEATGDPVLNKQLLEKACRVWKTRQAELLNKLNVLCPVCKELQDPDPDACRAMQEDAHEHVAERHGDVFTAQEVVDEGHMTWRKNNVKTYLRKIHPQNRALGDRLRGALVEAVAPELRDLNLPTDPQVWSTILWATAKPAARAAAPGPAPAAAVEQLMRACTALNWAAAQQLLTAYAEAELDLDNVWNDAGFNPLLLAVWQGEEAMVRALLERGASVTCEHRQRTGRGCLYLASEAGHPELVSLLLQHSAPLDIVDATNHETALMPAIMHGHMESLRILAASGAAPVEVPQFEGWRPVHYAAQFGSAQALRILAECGAHLDAEHEQMYRRTALHIAVERGHLRVWGDAGLGEDSCSAVKELVALGADVHRFDAFGATPLLRVVLTDGADRDGSAQIVCALVEGGADVNHRHEKYMKRTSLFVASELGQLSVVRALVESGADVKFQDECELNTSLMQALSMGRCEVVDYLAGLTSTPALVDIPQSQGWTPLHMAALMGKPEMASIL